MSGCDYEKKSFSVAMGGSSTPLTLDEQREAESLKAEREAESRRIFEETRKHLEKVGSQKVTRKLVPYGCRILVKRRKVEDKSSHIILPDEIKNLPTDIADVVEVPEQSFADRKLLMMAESIINALTLKATQGDAHAVDSLLKFKEYLQVMTIKKGDVLLMARYGGTDFLIQETNQMLCVAEPTGIYALVVETNKITAPTGMVEKAG